MELVHGKEAEVMENHSTSSRGLSPSRPANTGSGLHVNTNQCLSNGYEYVINMFLTTFYQIYHINIHFKHI